MSSSRSFVTWKSTRPFIWTALIWWAGGSIWIVVVAEETVSALKWMSLTWGLCLLDLTSMALALNAAIRLMAMADRPADALRRPAWTLQVFFWGTAKLACLGALIAVLIAGKAAPEWGLALGVSTLLVVPLVGGLWWSRSELSRGSRA